MRGQALGRRLLLQTLQLVQRRGVVGPLAGEHLIQHQPKRIQIALQRHLAPGKLLGRHVGRRPATHIAGDLFGKASQSKIHHVKRAVGVDHHVRWLQIAMQNALFMCRRHPRAQLTGHLQRLVRWQASNAPQQ